MKDLHTPRLLLREFRHGDLDDFYAYAKDPSVGPNAGWAPHTSRHQSKKILAHMIRRGGNWAIVEKATQTVIGSVSATVDTRRVGLPGYFEIGYVLAHPQWGQGYMTEVVQRLLQYLFEEKRANLVSARRWPDNTRSGRVLEKCGFHLEGTLRHTGTDSAGKIRDSVCYSMLPEEYHELYHKQ